VKSVLLESVEAGAGKERKSERGKNEGRGRSKERRKKKKENALDYLQIPPVILQRRSSPLPLLPALRDLLLRQLHPIIKKLPRDSKEIRQSLQVSFLVKTGQTRRPFHQERQRTESDRRCVPFVDGGVRVLAELVSAFGRFVSWKIRSRTARLKVAVDSNLRPDCPIGEVVGETASGHGVVDQRGRVEVPTKDVQVVREGSRGRFVDRDFDVRRLLAADDFVRDPPVVCLVLPVERVSSIRVGRRKSRRQSSGR
jgi:hypothetical protein